MPSVGFEPTILVSERPQTHALDRTVTGIGIQVYPCDLRKEKKIRIQVNMKIRNNIHVIKYEYSE
jgi:hypothetical protein